MLDLIGLMWNEIIARPMTNTLLVLYVLLASNLGLAIIAFTVLVRGATYKLVVRQIRQTRKMQEIGPRIKAVNEKYKSNSQLRQQEVMKTYREMGLNPIGCLGPMVIQMPIFIGLFWAIQNVVPFTPETLLGLSSKIYSWLPFLDTVVPVNREFLGMDLALQPMQSGNFLAFLLVGLSGVTMYVQQKMTQSPNPDPQQASTQKTFLYMFPIFFGFLSLIFPVGLVLYWVASNSIGILMQYLITSRGGLRAAPAASAPAVGSRLGPTATSALPEEERRGDGELQPGADGQDGGGGDRARDSRARRRPRRNRGRRR